VIYIYPAIFTPDTIEGRGTVYTVEIPDSFLMNSFYLQAGITKETIEIIKQI